jgi:metal-responsive CopG/Arc/MetJ family transcriptional regulator
MKTLRISDEAHRKLTATLGTIMAQTGKMQTYQDAIQAVLENSVVLPPEVLTEVDRFIKENKQLAYPTREEFIRDTIRFRIKWQQKDKICIEMPREQFDRLSEAIKDMNLPYRSPEDFINAQAKDLIEKSEKRKRTRKA